MKLIFWSPHRYERVKLPILYTRHPSDHETPFVLLARQTDSPGVVVLVLLDTALFRVGVVGALVVLLPITM
jgi:hypothetical protein